MTSPESQVPQPTRGLPVDAEKQLRLAIADPGSQVTRLRDEWDGMYEPVHRWAARAVLKMIEPWFATDVDPLRASAPSEASPAQHEVRMHGLCPGGDMHAKCLTCGEFRCVPPLQAEAWKDEHEGRPPASTPPASGWADTNAPYPFKVERDKNGRLWSERDDGEMWLFDAARPLVVTGPPIERAQLERLSGPLVSEVVSSTEQEKPE